MKDSYKNKKQDKKLVDVLDQAIEKMDMSEIENILEKLEANEPVSSCIEDSKLFAKRIIKRETKRSDSMNKNYKKIASLLVGIGILGGGITAYATGVLNHFTFFNKDNTQIVSSDQNLTKQEAKKLAKEAHESFDDDTQKLKAEQSTQVFHTLKDVKKSIDVTIVIPSFIPNDFVMDNDITANTTTFREDGVQHVVYTTYSSQGNENRRFGITVSQEKWNTSHTSITQTDAVYSDTYTTKLGDTFTLFKEDEGVIAQILFNDTEYSLVFLGVDEEEIHQILDSVDLSIYKQSTTH